MVQYLDVPQTPSIIFTPADNRQPSNKRTKARSLINGFYSSSARDTRDSKNAQNSGNYSRRSNSDYALPHIYNTQPTSTPPSWRLLTPFSKTDSRRRFAKSSPVDSPVLYSPPQSRRTSCSTKNEYEDEEFQFGEFKIRREHVPMTQTLQIILAEVLGTALLVFVGCAPSTSVMPWTFGFALMAAIQAFGPISGAHVNPGITIGAFIMGKLSNPFLVPVYWMSQFIGALIGYSLHYYIVLPSFPNSQKICMNKMNLNISPVQGVLLETIVMFWFLLTLCAFWDPKNNNTAAQETSSLKFGLIMSGLLWSMEGIIPLSLNTARSFAPALLNNDFQDHWIYWIGPNIGALLASLVYRFLLFPRPYLYPKDDE